MTECYLKSYLIYDIGDGTKHHEKLSPALICEKTLVRLVALHGEKNG